MERVISGSGQCLVLGFRHNRHCSGRISEDCPVKDPEYYRGREQTYLKHFFLEKYLERVAYNIGYYKSRFRTVRISTLCTEHGI